jgi:MFS family permease
MRLRVERAPGVPVALLAAAFLFNLGQGVLRPSLPLYLQQAFGANYRMVTLIPVVFGAGKWAASVPTGYLLDRLGRPLMIWGLLLIASVDIASVLTPAYPLFLGLRGLGGVGWAMFATVATTAMVNRSAARGRTVSLLLMSETSGLLLGSAAGGFMYQSAGASPFVFEAACMLVAALTVARWAGHGPRRSRTAPPARGAQGLRAVLRMPGVQVAAVTNAVLIAVQTGVLVFLFPLFLVNRASAAPGAVGLLVSLSVLGRLLALWLGGGLSDRWGRMRVLIPGLLGFAALLGSLTFARGPVWLGVFSVALGAVTGVIAPVPAALVGDQVPPALQGVAIGWLRAMTDGGQIAGPLLMGAVADAVDLAAPFLLAAALLLATAWPCARHARAMSRAQGS